MRKFCNNLSGDIGLATWSTKHPVLPSGAQADRGKGHGMASRCRQRKLAHSRRRQALTSFHRLVEGIAVSDVDNRAAAAKFRKIGECRVALWLRGEHQA
jgi:hypothetical protein